MKGKGILYNYIYNTIYEVLRMILPLLIIPYLSRVIGAEGIGIYSYTHSIADYFFMFAMLGIGIYGNRMVAKVKDRPQVLNQIFSEIYFLQVMTSLIVLITYLIYIDVFCKHYLVIRWLQGIYIVSVIFDIHWLYFGLEEFKSIMNRKIAIKILTMISIFIFVKTKQDLPLYTAIISVGELIGQLLLWFPLRRYITFKKVSLKTIKKHIQPSIMLFFPLLATSIYRVMDKIMVGLLSSMKEIGIYENAEKAVMVCLGVISALGTVMMPRIAHLVANHDLKKTKQYLIQSIEMVIFIASAITFGIASIAIEFAPIFYGPEFKECGSIMRLLSITILFIAWSNVIRTQYLIPMEKDTVYIKSVIIGAFINLIMNSFLIGPMGARGASIATIVTEASVAIYQSIQCRKEIDIRECIRKTRVFLVIGMGMYILVRTLSKVIHGTIWALLIQIAVGSIFYLSISLIYFIKTNNSIVETLLIKLKNSSVHKKNLLLIKMNRKC